MRFYFFSLGVLFAAAVILFFSFAVRADTPQAATPMPLNVAQPADDTHNDYYQQLAVNLNYSDEIAIFGDTIDTLATYKQVAPLFCETDIDMLTQMTWGEARGTSIPEMRLAIWVVFQRVDSDCGRWPNDIQGVIMQYMQFYGWQPHFPVSYVPFWTDVDIRDVVIEELEK